MRVLVTGASGFVGRALTRALANAGIKVRAAARNVSAIPSGANIEAATLPDLSRPVDWRPLLRNIDAVVHLAGIAHVSNDIPVIPVPPEWIGAALRASGKENVWERIGASLVADCAKLRAAGWQPPTDTPQALAELARPPRP